jgi:hypothetical protein
MVLFLMCLSWNVLLGPLLWWHRELFFGWNTMGANVGGVQKFGWNPRTWVEGKSKRSSTQVMQEKTKNLLKTAQTSKVANPFTRALAPPFIGRRRDFYIPKIPSSLKNIPSVNMYMNIFYISYIYKPTTSSHTKPGLFETTSLTWLLTDSWISPLRKSSCAATSELELQRTPEFCRLPISWFCRFMTSGASQVQDFRSSQVRNFGASQVRDSGSLQVQDSWASRAQDSRSSQVQDSWASQVLSFRSPQVRDFGASQVQDSRFHRFEIPENLFHEFHKSRRFEGDGFSWIPQHCWSEVLKIKSSKEQKRKSIRVACYWRKESDSNHRRTYALNKNTINQWEHGSIWQTRIQEYYPGKQYNHMDYMALVLSD